MHAQVLRTISGLSAALLLWCAAAAQEQAQIGLSTVAEGFVSPVHLTAPNGDERLFVVDRPGYIYVIDGEGNLLEEPFLDLSEDVVELMERFDERGLLGLAFHPQYAENGRFYVYYSVPLQEDAPDDWNHTSRISEFKVSEEDPNLANPNSERVLLEVHQPQFNHNAGSLAFSPADGFLYIALGDGGAGDDVGLGHPPMGHGQDITSTLGNILRIDVDRGWPGYAIPQDNPFVGTQGVDETYAWGWRNPWRMSFDRGGDNALYVATNGQNLWEAVYQVTEPGNYGWNILEGTHCFDPENPDESPDECPREGPNGEPLHLPVIEYPHLDNRGDSDIAGISVIGGYVYRGEALPELQGNYLFGDWSQSFGEPAGQVLMATPSDQAGELWPLEQLMALDSFVLGFGEDSGGELYVLTTNNTGPTGNTGRVLQIVAAGEGDVSPAGGQQEDQDAGEEEGGDGSGEQQEDGAGEDQEGEGQEGEGQAGQAGQGNGWFTANQADQGATAYAEFCQECHGANMEGIGQFPALTGDTFVSRWAERGAGELYEYMSTMMPLDDPGGLDEETYLNIMSYWLSNHGFEAGEQALTADRVSEVPLGE